MDEMRQFSKVREVVAVKKIKLNDKLIFHQRVVLCFNVEETIRGSVVEQPADDTRLYRRATREYNDSRLAVQETHE